MTSRNIASWIITAGLALTPLACRPAAPPSFGISAPAWVKGEVREALARHGTFKGDSYLIFLDYIDNSFGYETHAERLVRVRGLEIDVKLRDLSAADKLNQYKWVGDVSLTATAYQQAEPGSGVFGPWQDGLDPLMGRILTVSNRNEVVTWEAPGIFPAGAEGRDNFFDSLFNAYRPPDDPPTRRASTCAVRLLLSRDKAISESVERGKDGQEDHARIAEAMQTIRMDGCPTDVRAAYVRHIRAWCAADQAAITATYRDLLGIARAYGVGTSRYAETGGDRVAVR